MPRRKKSLSHPASSTSLQSRSSASMKKFEFFSFSFSFERRSFDCLVYDASLCIQENGSTQFNQSDFLFSLRSLSHWKIKAEKQGYFTLEEWRRGLKALRADTLTKLRKALSELEKEVRRPSNFVDFCSYSFRYYLTEENQKSIDIESICQLPDLVLGSQF